MYKFLEHLADIKFKIIADNFEGILIESLKAINYYLGPKIIENKKALKLVLNKKIEEKIDFLVDFLSEILSLTYIKKTVFEINKIGIKGNKIYLIGYPFRKLSREIKAITYHQAELFKRNNKIIFEFIVDV